MLVFKRTSTNYKIGGHGLFDMLMKIGSKAVTDLPQKLATSAVEGAKSAVISGAKRGAETVVQKVVNKIIKPKPPVKPPPVKANSINVKSKGAIKKWSQPTQSTQPTQSKIDSGLNLNSLIDGYGLKKISGSGIVLY